MGGPSDIMWSEKVRWSKTDSMWFYLYVESKTNQNKQNKAKGKIHRENRLLVTTEKGHCGEGKIREGDHLYGDGW